MRWVLRRWRPLCRACRSGVPNSWPIPCRVCSRDWAGSTLPSPPLVQELLAHPDSEWHEYRGRGAIRGRVCAFLAPRAEHPNTQARARGDVMFGCSDVYHWMGRAAKAVCLPDCGRTCPKAHNLDATTFWFRAPNFGDPAQRHRQFCASSSLTEGTRALDVAAVGVQGRGASLTSSFAVARAIA